MIPNGCVNKLDDRLGAEHLLIAVKEFLFVVELLFEKRAKSVTDRKQNQSMNSFDLVQRSGGIRLNTEEGKERRKFC